MNPYRIVWLRVLIQALVDCVNPKPCKYPRLKEGIQNDAKDFLFGRSKDWVEARVAVCEAAGIPLEPFLKRAAYIFDNSIEIKDVDAFLRQLQEEADAKEAEEATDL